MTKKEMEERIIALETRVSDLQRVKIQPYPQPVYPPWYYTYPWTSPSYPHVQYGGVVTTTVPSAASGTVSGTVAYTKGSLSG